MNKDRSNILLIVIVLFSVLGITPITIASTFKYPHAENIIPGNSKSSIQVYSMTVNRHGRILKTSVGTFYLGRSGDAIHQVSGRKRYGYWHSNGERIRIYIADDIYTFYL